jgi:hypothetical protein
MAEEKGRMEIEQVSDDQARQHLAETYANPEVAGRFFDEMIETRKKALDGLTEELNGDEHLAEAFARNPLGMLNERKLLGPLDQITLEGLSNPFVHWPWPWPRCRLVCRVETFTEVRWVCIGFWPLRICWPTLVVRFRWVCRIVCD